MRRLDDRSVARYLGTLPPKRRAELVGRKVRQRTGSKLLERRWVYVVAMVDELGTTFLVQPVGKSREYHVSWQHIDLKDRAQLLTDKEVYSRR